MPPAQCVHSAARRFVQPSSFAFVNMLERLFRHLLLPAYEGGLKRRKAFAYWGELERSQWLPTAGVDELQLRALCRLVSHALRHCPYYRESWTAQGLDPDQIQRTSDFQTWPVISRATIQENRLGMRADNAGRLIHKATGGSSGVPLAFDLDDQSLDRRTAAWHRGYAWAGAAPGTRHLYVWGVPLGQRTRRAIAKDRLYNALYRRRVLNCFELSEESAPQFIGAINRYKPEVIVAYTNPLYTLAQIAQDRKLQVRPPKSIVVGAEKIHGFQRDLIERVFGAPVFETYGCREFMLIGAECDRHEGLHLTSENLLVEVLDDDGSPTPDGEEGNVVVTDLYNYGMPFIRYANGDRAVAGWSACSCGRGLPLLRKVVGRQLDIIETPDGRRVPGEFFPHLIKDFPAVRQFQVVQEAPDFVRLLLVIPGDLEPAQRARLEAEVRKILGDRTRIEFERVREIPLTRSGKLRVVVNRCRNEAAPASDVAACAEVS